MVLLRFRESITHTILFLMIYNKKDSHKSFNYIRQKIY